MSQEIVGMGIDLIEIDRLEKAIVQSKERFLNRIFLPNELAYCQSMNYPMPHFAARFAAKEAVSKAFGTGIGAEIGWLDIEVVRNEATHAPGIELHGKGVELAKQRNVKKIFLSLTHTNHYASAQVLLTT